ncbi:hypothetical protein [Arcticibacter pallidicorallinus]|nr:hypothetical protein [Arcticibacter pallidicorallinus]
MLKGFIKAVVCLTVIWFSSHAVGQAQIVVNPDGSHSIVAGNVAINPDGTHSVIVGNIAINPNGTHSVIMGNTVVNPNGTHSVIVGGSQEESTSYMRSKKSDYRSITWSEYRQAKLARKEGRRKAREARRLMKRGNEGGNEL